MATCRDIIANIRSQILEPAPGFWKDEEIFGYIKECIQLLGADVHYETESTLALTGTTRYTLPTGILKIHRAQLSDGITEVKLADFGKMGNPDDSTDPFYIIHGEFIYVYPALTDTMTLFVTQRVVPPTTMDDTPNIPTEYQAMLENYGVYKCKLKDSDETYAEYQATYMNLRNQLAEELSKTFRTSPYFHIVEEDGSDM
jgi:hypothetical protein